MKQFKFFIQFILIPVMMTSVVMYQMSQIKQGLSRWKGGGFGMYADYYPLDYEMFVNGEKILLDKHKNYEQYKFGRMLVFYPTARNVLKTVQHVPAMEDTLFFELKSPDFNGKLGLYSYKTIYDTTIIRNKKSK